MAMPGGLWRQFEEPRSWLHATGPGRSNRPLIYWARSGGHWQNPWLRLKMYALPLLERPYTIADEPLLPPDVHVTSNLAYIMWYGRGSKPSFNYRSSREQLQEWIPKIN